MTAPTPDRPIERSQKGEAKGNGGERLSPKARFAKTQERTSVAKSKLEGVLTGLSQNSPGVNLASEQTEFAQQAHRR